MLHFAGHLLVWAVVVGLSSRGCGYLLRRYLKEFGPLTAPLASILGVALVMLCFIAVFWGAGVPNPWTFMSMPHGLGFSLIGWVLWDIVRLESNRQVFLYTNRWQRIAIAAVVPVIVSLTVIVATGVHWVYKPWVAKRVLNTRLNKLSAQVSQRQDLQSCLQPLNQFQRMLKAKEVSVQALGATSYMLDLSGPQGTTFHLDKEKTACNFITDVVIAQGQLPKTESAHWLSMHEATAHP